MPAGGSSSRSLRGTRLRWGGKGWQTIRYAAAEIAGWENCNVGVLLGSASGGLCDIDLDCAEAIELAPHFLPVTWCFGRASKPRSHWLYQCEGAKSHAFIDEVPDEAGKKRTLLEIRANASTGPGHQTVFPGSHHKDTGEPISWDADAADATDGPRVIDWPELAGRVARMARATVARRAGAAVGEALAFAAEYRPVARPAPTCATDAPGGSDVVRRARAYVARMPAAVSGQGGRWNAAAKSLIGEGEITLSKKLGYRIAADEKKAAGEACQGDAGTMPARLGEACRGDAGTMPARLGDAPQDVPCQPCKGGMASGIARAGIAHGGGTVASVGTPPSDDLAETGAPSPPDDLDADDADGSPSPLVCRADLAASPEDDEEGAYG